MKILHDAVPYSLFHRLKTFIEDESFSWYYCKATAYGSDAISNLYSGSFSHTAFSHQHGKNSSFSDFSESCLYTILDKMEVKIKKLIRIRVGFIPISGEYYIHSPHVDFTIPHKVGILYMNDSDGDTILYNEKYDPNHLEGSFSYYQKVLKEKVSISERSTPKENKFIMFDGASYHSSSTPIKTKKRISINYTFETHD
jgi:hypothetical protein